MLVYKELLYDSRLRGLLCFSLFFYSLNFTPLESEQKKIFGLQLMSKMKEQYLNKILAVQLIVICTKLFDKPS